MKEKDEKVSFSNNNYDNLTNVYVYAYILLLSYTCLYVVKTCVFLSFKLFFIIVSLFFLNDEITHTCLHTNSVLFASCTKKKSKQKRDDKQTFSLGNRPCEKKEKKNYGSGSVLYLCFLFIGPMQMYSVFMNNVDCCLYPSFTLIRIEILHN